MAREFRLPDLGEGVHEGQIVRLLVAEGDAVREDQPLMEVETDKAAVEIPSPFTGTVSKWHVKEGQVVNVGDVMVSVVTGEAASSSASTEHTHHVSAKSSIAASSTSTSATTARPAPGRAPASPAVRKLARQLNVDLDSVRGSGPGGRISREDVEHAASNAAPKVKPATPAPLPSVRSAERVPAKAIAARVYHAPLPESTVVEPAGTDDSDQYGLIRRAPITQARKTIAAVMSQSWSTIPHATDFDDADVTELDRLRRGYAAPDGSDRKLTMLAFVIRAVVRGLQRFPEFNASIDIERGEVIYKRYINIAVGVHSERGLVPMVLRDADRMSIPQISDELAIISEKARTASFAVNDTRGGTYTISNAGAMGGSRYSTPIITPPQVAVLALGRSRWMPWVMEGDQHAIAPRLILPLSHSIDHRLLDGGQEVQFMRHVIADLQNPARLLL